jgi:hypothetical protein
MRGCIRVPLLGCLALSLAACASLGNGAIKTLSEDGARQVLSAGKTTKAELVKAMGEASVQTFRNGYEVWVYNYKPGLPAVVGYLPLVGTLANMVDATTSEKELAVLFDRDGIVKKYQFRVAESQVERLLAR